MTTIMSDPTRLSVLNIPESSAFGPQINFERLRVRIVELHTSQIRIAALAGMNPNTLNHALRGRRVVSMEQRFHLAYIARVTGLDDGTVVTSEGLALPSVQVAAR